MVILANLRIYKLTALLLSLVLALTLISFGLGIMANNQGVHSELWEKAFKLFNVDFERNIPTWFSSVALAFTGLQFMVVAYYRKLLQKHYVLHWFFLGLIFMGISLDEFGQLHEQSIRPLREMFDTSGMLYYPWIIPAALLTLIVGLIYFPFIKELIGETGWAFILAGALYVGGALGIEAIGGFYFDNFMRSQPIDYDVAYLFLTHIEELSEMFGIVLFLHVGIRYVQMMGLANLETES